MRKENEHVESVRLEPSWAKALESEIKHREKIAEIQKHSHKKELEQQAKDFGLTKKAYKKLLKRRGLK